jgi:4-diphosphocytidyl-2-C-methyl-D-erythritol kinase
LTLSRLAPAKVNLFLHVGPVEADGYHPVSSLMVFADIGDRLTIGPADYPAFESDGPFAAALGDGLNLVERAWGLVAERAHVPMAPFRLILTKLLPVAAGLGGGSSDAGVALKLIRDSMGLPLDDEALIEIARELGADGPACFRAEPVLGEGRGDRLSPAPAMPPVDAVLVNPGVPCSTGAVYRAFDLGGAKGGADTPGLPEVFEDVSELAAVLSFCRNDLEAPATQVAPEVATVLDTLRGAPETLLARMSGSGATCFALCASTYDAEALAEQVAALSPRWWVQRCRLGGPWPEG